MYVLITLRARGGGGGGGTARQETALRPVLKEGEGGGGDSGTTSIRYVRSMRANAAVITTPCNGLLLSPNFCKPELPLAVG